MKKKNAISIIVLVITIIVMAILAATVIITLSNTNIINKANEAVKKTETQQIEEMKALMLADGMMGNNPEPVTIGDTTLTWDDTNKEVVEKKFGYVVKSGVVIPTGFYYVGGTKTDGLVISDNSADQNKGVDYKCVGNQFVWIPVEYTATGTNDSNGLDTGFTAVFKRTSTEGKEPPDAQIVRSDGKLLTEAEPEERSEYYAMALAVQKNNGFYIARYQAGSVTDNTEKIVSKKDFSVKNETWKKDVELSRNMYKGSSSVGSTLCYDVQWDSIVNFISSDASWKNGNKPYHTYDSDGNINGIVESEMKTTGYSEEWKVKNIYDLSGNGREYTMAALYQGAGEYEEYRRSTRGANASNSDPKHDASTFLWYDGNSFRVALYLK